MNGHMQFSDAKVGPARLAHPGGGAQPQGRVPFPGDHDGTRRVGHWRSGFLRLLPGRPHEAAPLPGLWSVLLAGLLDKIKKARPTAGNLRWAVRLCVGPHLGTMHLIRRRMFSGGREFGALSCPPSRPCSPL